MGADGSVVKARYTYVYVFEDNEWKISQHHSSVMPEAIVNTFTATANCQAATTDQVRGLFSLWNNALATLNPDTVAARYSSKAVLLPTVSNIPRNSKALITSYFVDFLKKKP